MTKVKSSYNQKIYQEQIVRKNLMNLVAEKYIEKSESEEWKEWLEESSCRSEGMCVGWSWMFIENEQEITKLWQDLQEENHVIATEDKKLYEVLGKKLWYRYIDSTMELEGKKRGFKKMPIEKNKEDMILSDIKKGREDKCNQINEIEDKDKLYDKILEKIIKIIEGEKDYKKRHYIKLDNKAHSMVIAFDAFKINKGMIVLETACNGIEQINKENLKDILQGAFEGEEAIKSEFSIERFSRSLETMKSPSVSLSGRKCDQLLLEKGKAID